MNRNMERSREHKQQKAGEARGACFLQGLSSDYHCWTYASVSWSGLDGLPSPVCQTATGVYGWGQKGRSAQAKIGGQPQGIPKAPGDI